MHIKLVGRMERFIRGSILSKFVLLLLVFLLIPLIMLGPVSYSLSANVLKNELNTSNSNTMDKLATNIEMNMQNLNSTAAILCENSAVQSAIKANIGKTAVEADAVDAVIWQTIISTKMPIQLEIIDLQGNVYIDKQFYSAEHAAEMSALIRGAAWYGKLFKYDPSLLWVGDQENYDRQNGGARVLYFAKNIISDDAYLGTALIGLPDYFLSKQMNNLKISDQSEIYLIDSGGNPVLKSEDSSNADAAAYNELFKAAAMAGDASYTALKGGRKYNVNVKKLSDFDLKIVSLTPESSIYEKLYSIQNNMLLFVCVSLALIFVSILLIRRSIVAPIVNLSKLMITVRNGDLAARSGLNRKDEIGVLADGFNGMLEEINGLIDTVKEEEKAKRDLEFKVLLAQIKPHFIYNTLNSIKWMAEIKGEKNIAKSISSFVKMIEYNMNDRSKFVSLRQEIDYLHGYIYLCNIRYGNSIDSGYDIAGEAWDASVLKLILQPIVENSVGHGLAGQPGKGMIAVKAVLDGPDLIVSVTDNGRGMDGDSLESLRRCLAGDGQKPRGLGLINVHNRIRMEYGDPYGLRIASAPRRGTQVDIVLPYRKHEEGGGDGIEDIDR